MSASNPTHDPQRTESGRWKLLLLLLVTLAPVIASYFTYYVIRPQGENFYGQLISPQVELPDLETKDSQGKAVNLRSLQGQWLLITVADAACDAACENKLYLSRQIHIGLGAEQERVERIWLSLGDQAVPERLSEDVSEVHDRVPRPRRSRRCKRGCSPSQRTSWQTISIWSTPRAYWMMRFPPDPDVKAAASIKKNPQPADARREILGPAGTLT
jgi:hypothetical protein